VVLVLILQNVASDEGEGVGEMRVVGVEVVAGYDDDIGQWSALLT
jgi:hypothetical protein